MAIKNRKQTRQGTQRAAIYVRVSSEKQADKVSPEAQESDARELCKRQGYIVTEVYRDTEKYRANGRMVEPSGTRHDRPQFKRMMKDADAGLFDMIIAWREDRLYRGVNRAMLEISERVKAGAISVELVKEHYDPAIAEVKAWAAGIELQAKHDRHLMGVAGRLAAGKIWGSNTPYGYDYDKAGGRWVINESEAEWVRRVWQWFGSGVSMREIQSRLITGGVKQKGVSWRKHVWSYECIRNICKRDEYYTGQLCMKWDDVEYHLIVPVIIDQATYQAAKDRQARYKAYPAGNYKHYALAGGKLHCVACADRMHTVRHQGRKGGKFHYYYRCSSVQQGTDKDGCAKHINMAKTDAEIWRKVWDVISDPEKLEAKINAEIERLQAQRADAQGDCDKIQGGLDELTMKRQQAIAWALAKIISEDDLKMQLTGFDWQAASLQHELAEASLLTGNREAKLRAIADDLRGKVEVGRELLALENPTEEQQADLLNFKKEMIQALVTRVDVHTDKSITVTVEFTDEPEEADQALLISETSSQNHLR